MNSFSIAWNANEIFTLNPTEKRPSSRSKVLCDRIVSCILLKSNQMIFLVQFGINKHYKLYEPRAIFCSLRKIYLCLFICTRNHSNTYTNLLCIVTINIWTPKNVTIEIASVTIFFWQRLWMLEAKTKLYGVRLDKRKFSKIEKMRNPFNEDSADHWTLRKSCLNVFWKLFQEFKKLKNRKTDRTVGLNFCFSNISSGTAWLLQGINNWRKNVTI